MVDIHIELPEHFLDEEVRCGYTVTSDMKKVWAVELDLLNKLLEVCKKYDIRIYASGGTMLGAVRHAGFIPWDDDIDMMMPRDQYMKLCEVADKEFRPPYFFQTEYTDPGTLRGHAQLRNSETTAILKGEFGKEHFNQGIFLDIFPLDNVTEDDTLFQKQGKRALHYRKIAYRIKYFTVNFDSSAQHGIKGAIKRVLHFLFGKAIIRCRAEEYFYSKFENECQRYNSIETMCFSTLSFQFFTKQHIKWKADYENIIEVPFEFMTIPIGENYDHALLRRYGNYKEFVKGRNDHGEVIFDTEYSYREYLKRT